MTEQEYNRVSRAAYAVRKLKDGKLAALTPADLELVKRLLKDKDGYVEQAVAHNRPAWKATKDVERCEWAVAQQAQPAPARSYPDTCKHGVSGPFDDPCPQCSAEYGYPATICE